MRDEQDDEQRDLEHRHEPRNADQRLVGKPEPQADVEDDQDRERGERRPARLGELRRLLGGLTGR